MPRTGNGWRRKERRKGGATTYRFVAYWPSSTLDVQAMHKLAVLWVLRRFVRTQHRGYVRFNRHLVQWQASGTRRYLHNGGDKGHGIEETGQPQ